MEIIEDFIAKINLELTYWPKMALSLFSSDTKIPVRTCLPKSLPFLSDIVFS